MDQESPNIYPLNVRVTQELRMQLERLAERRGFSTVAACCRAILIDAAALVELTDDDYKIIRERIAQRKEALDARKSRRH